MAVISTESREVYSLMTGQELVELQGIDSMRYLDGRCEIKRKNERNCHSFCLR